MEGSLAQRYLNREIDVEEYTAAVNAEAEEMARQDLARRVRQIVIEVGGSASDQIIIRQEEQKEP